MANSIRSQLAVITCVVAVTHVSAAVAVPPSNQSVASFQKSSEQRNLAFAKIPDWRGFWEQFNIGASGTPDPSEVERNTAGPAPVFTTLWQQKLRTEKKQNPATDRQCTFGFPTLLESSPLIFEVVSIPEETLMVFNGRETRHIYTDGLGHTPDDIRVDTPWGDSVGKWNGSTLEIETVGAGSLFRFRNAYGKRDSTMLSDDAVYDERVRMTDRNTLEDAFTVSDPQALRQPYHFTRRYHRIVKMTRVAEELDCESSGTNERNYDTNGNLTLLPSPK